MQNKLVTLVASFLLVSCTINVAGNLKCVSFGDLGRTKFWRLRLKSFCHRRVLVTVRRERNWELLIRSPRRRCRRDRTGPPVLWSWNLQKEV